ncbi:hypothetical protein ABB37_04128 [Leptomonas pyrrhocoris]|uniref:EF-hand domain-containing protein n=1 Tax=Leptomonas pyrrhocoris TaxID=157538 RepID=A0A0N0VFX4_LEPPY|nr:hypothetical protein ABB37_04128 [Leptomonas pyrrhocoris]KPA81878.1 hypothetical protein ABB37_04128 [Leptomonas pyrrhocoris]|eukprot:XP_015660317.1 hypothetical protein ABB37_04128 [Leptomonas pyrrhocoris]
MEQDYQVSIARARQADNESRARRRALRNAQQERIFMARDAYAHSCFLSDVRFHISRHSIAEENMMYTLRTTAACWADVCDRAITRQLDIEAAQKNHTRREDDYLEHTRQREVLEQQVTEESDMTRWRELNVRHAARMRAMCTQAVEDAVADIWSRTSQCLTTLHESRLDHAGTELLVALAADTSLLSPTSAEGEPLRSSPAATREAFQHIFNGSPYAKTSAAILALLQYCYSQHHIAVPLASVLHLCPFPILVVDGPKYSGKTLLTDFLRAKYRLLCVSDESLVRRALQAAQDFDANHGAENVEGGEGDNGSRTSAEWITRGQGIRDDLLSGGAVSAMAVSELLFLYLKELQTDGVSLPYDALLLEGVFRTAESYKVVAQRFRSLPTHPYASLKRQWNLVETEKVEGDVRASVSMLSETSAVAAALADIPDVLRLASPLSSERDAPVKQEPKARPMKKVDLAALPPAELPEVDDTKEAQEKECAFVAQATSELASLPTVLSGVLNIRCSPEEVFRRFAGLRLDLETGAVYHLTYNPPPKERLLHVVNMGRPDMSSVELYEAVFHHREEWAAVQRWLSRQPAGSVFARVYELAGDGALEQLQQDALQVVGQNVSNFRISQEVLAAREASMERLATLEATEKAQIADRESERVRLAAIYNEKGAPLPPLLQTPVEGTGRFIPTFGAPAAGVILRAVSDFTEEYGEEYGAMWLRATHLTKLLLVYFNGAEEQVAAYWSRPDDKQVILQRCQNCLDGVPAQLRALAACKAELHLLLDNLYDALHHCIEQRDAEAKGLIDTLCNPASFLAGWETLVCQEFTRLLQCEADRFVLALHLFTFFYGTITGEPLAFDEVDIDVPAFTVNPADRPAHMTAASAEGSAASANSGSRPGKEKRAAASKKTHSKAAEEQSEKSAEEQFADAAQGVLSGVTSVTDKLKGVLDAQVRGQKRNGGGGGNAGGGGSGGAGNAGGAATAHFLSVTAKCLEVMEAEKTVTTGRVVAIQTFVQTLLREAETHAQQRRAYLESTLVTQMSKEAAAVNTAVYVLRSCVETERRSPKMHLGCTTFAGAESGIDGNARPLHGSAELSLSPSGGRGAGRGGTVARRSFITDVPLSSQLRDPQLTLHPGLTAARLLDLIQQFRCVAPDYQLSRFDFSVLIRESDYAEAVATRLDTAHMELKNGEEVFHAFDPLLSGFLDWRDLVVHLLFWVVPASPIMPAPSTLHAAEGRKTTTTPKGGGMPEVTLQDLLDTRLNLGAAPLTEEQFFDLPFFYDRYLDDTALEAYTRVLWSTFCDSATQTVEPYVLLGFLCADPQPIRGTQKAFQLLSPLNSAGRVALDEMDALCHLKANNARAMNQLDPCSKANLRLLFGAMSTLAFEDVCLSPLGRKMLNHADLYRRRTFVKRKPLP